MTTLTDSYVSATLRSVPQKQREEIERELRASIADDVEARIHAGASLEDAEYAALASLGSPARLAANYTGRTLTLIGPATYLTYITLLKVVAWAVLPIVAIVVAVIQYIPNHNLIGAIFGGIGQALMVGVYLAFFVTLAFVLVDRSANAEVKRGLVDGEWTPRSLILEAPRRTIGWGEAIASLVGAIALVAAVIVERTLSPVSTTSGVPIPILDPYLFDGWMYYFLAVLVLGVVLDFIRVGIARWNPIAAFFDTILQLAGGLVFAWLLYSAQIVNPRFWRAIGHPEWAVPGNWLVLVGAIVVVLIVLGHIVQTYSRANRKASKTTLPAEA